MRISVPAIKPGWGADAAMVEPENDISHAGRVSGGPGGPSSDGPVKVPDPDSSCRIENAD